MMDSYKVFFDLTNYNYVHVNQDHGEQHSTSILSGSQQQFSQDSAFCSQNGTQDSQIRSSLSGFHFKVPNNPVPNDFIIDGSQQISQDSAFCSQNGTQDSQSQQLASEFQFKVPNHPFPNDAIIINQNSTFQHFFQESAFQSPGDFPVVEGVEDFSWKMCTQEPVYETPHTINGFVENDHLFSQIDKLTAVQPEIIARFQKYLENRFPVPTRERIIESLQSVKNMFLLADRKVRKGDRQKSKNDQTPVVSFTKKNKYYRNIIKTNTENLFSKEVGITVNPETKRYKAISVKRKTIMMGLIRKLIASLDNGHCHMPRDYYYQNTRLFKNTTTLVSLLDDLCCTINVSRIDLNIFGGNKGFVYGDLTYLLDGETVHCGSIGKSATLIPNGVKNLAILPSPARFILVVEKFSTMNHLISYDVCDKLGIILVTGCGYPDLKTRYFVQKLWIELKIPVFALVDGDAYGIDIALCYKYGGISSAHQNHNFIVPEIRWLGIGADDIVEFRLQGTQFGNYEKRKFKSLKNRPDIKQEKDWCRQIIHMQKLGIKVEIQELLSYWPEFLSECYLPYKLFNGRWI